MVSFLYVLNVKVKYTFLQIHAHIHWSWHQTLILPNTKDSGYYLAQEMTYMTMAWNCTFAHSLHEIRIKGLFKKSRRLLSQNK